MKIFGLTLVLALVLVGAIAGAAAADVATIDVYAGWNQISCPLVPINYGIAGDGSDDYTEPYYGFNAVADDLLNYNLYRPEASNGSTWIYLINTEFGKLLLGDDYMLNASVGATITYPGLPSGVPDTGGIKTDMWISLPGLGNDGQDKGGWHLIGVPYATDIVTAEVPVETVLWRIWITDGTQVVDWMTAADTLSLVDSTLYGSGGVTKTYGDTLTSGQAYWFNTKKDNLAMIITFDAKAAP